MTSVDILVQEQLTDIKIIQRIVPNFKKLGQSNFTVAIINRRIDHLKELQTNLSRRHSALQSMVTEKERTELQYFKADSFLDILDRLESDLDYFTNLRVSLSKPAQVSGETTAAVTESETKTRVKLPLLELPKFDGAYEKWETFRDRFSALILSEKVLSDLEKMHYLCAALSGKPLEAISHLNVTEANFEIAWNVIVSRYNNERRIIIAHLRTLMSLPSVRANSVKSLRVLRDTITISLQALSKLNRPIHQWDDLLVYLIITKLDTAARNALELKLSDSTNFPSFSTIDEFLQARLRMLDALALEPSEANSPSEKANKLSKLSSHSAMSGKLACIVCKKDHALYQCPTFLSYSVSRRRQIIAGNQRCFNCCRVGHSAPNCTNVHRCRECQRKHHTLLHIKPEAQLNANATPFSISNVQNNSAINSNDSISKPSDISNDSPSNVHSLCVTGEGKTAAVLLATAMVKVHSPEGTCKLVRALLDQGSEATFITENLANSLNLEASEMNVMITGVGNSKTAARRNAIIRISPAFANTPNFTTSAIILPFLTSYPSSRLVPVTPWKHIQNLCLADNNPCRSDDCKILIGADLYGLTLCDGIRAGRVNEPIAQKTVFGWILSDRFLTKPDPDTASLTISSHHITSAQLDKTLRQFWQLENIAAPISLLPSDQQCEEHFATTHSRTESGRYVVRLPFKSGNLPSFPASYDKALVSFYRLEKRLLQNPDTSQKYHSFLKEYEQLNHMRKISVDEDCSVAEPYYIPHHAVIRESSITTRLRVVFNASSKTSNGQSLNDYLLTGQKFQPDLGSIIMRFR